MCWVESTCAITCLTVVATGYFPIQQLLQRSSKAGKLIIIAPVTYKVITILIKIEEKQVNFVLKIAPL
jgi:hypothetical protein